MDEETSLGGALYCEIVCHVYTNITNACNIEERL
jgi:hypothetical protein